MERGPRKWFKYGVSEQNIVRNIFVIKIFCNKTENTKATAAELIKCSSPTHMSRL